MIPVLCFEPVFCRVLIQKPSDVVDFSTRAMANELPVTVRNLLSFENNRVCHPPNILCVRDTPSPIFLPYSNDLQLRELIGCPEPAGLVGGRCCRAGGQRTEPKTLTCVPCSCGSKSVFVLVGFSNEGCCASRLPLPALTSCDGSDVDMPINT